MYSENILSNIRKEGITMQNQPTPIQHPTTFGQWSENQKCQIAEMPGTWVIDSINIFDAKGPYEFEQVNCTKLKRDGNRSKYNACVRASQLLEIGAKQPNVDKNGLTALQVATELFKSGFAKHDYCNTTRETLLKVVSISKSGRVKAQRINIKSGITTRSKTVEGHKHYSQEDKLLNLTSLEYELRGKSENFCPRLYSGDWQYWKDGAYIEAPTMQLTWLLD